jgi:hypothetical protein
MKKILVHCDTNWAIGRIYKDLNKYLEKDFLLSYYDWAIYHPNYILELLDNFDILITNLVNIKYFINVPPEKLKKMIFSCHGYIEFHPLNNFIFPKEPIYSIVSKSVETLFPENMRKKLFHTYNGVELTQFNYIKHFDYLLNPVPIVLDTFWVNFQKKYEFNPVHNHDGLYSFVIWINVPYNVEDENKSSPGIYSNYNTAGMFSMLYSDSIGGIKCHDIVIDKSKENNIIIFPSKFYHCVYPFFSSDDYRISVSGNFKLQV